MQAEHNGQASSADTISPAVLIARSPLAELVSILTGAGSILRVPPCYHGAPEVSFLSPPQRTSLASASQTRGIPGARCRGHRRPPSRRSPPSARGWEVPAG